MGKSRDEMHPVQMAWKQRTLPYITEPGQWQKKSYDHILPVRHRQENLWPGIRATATDPKWRLDSYLHRKQIQPHTGRDNLLSSWTLAANLYFPFGRTEIGRRLLAAFLASAVEDSIAAVEEVELEHSVEALRPPTLLGETDGGRGSNQTSPDVAFVVVLKSGEAGIVLTEVKFTEHSFYACSIRKQLGDGVKAATCHDLAALGDDPKALCGQHTVKSRKYWDHLDGVFDWDAPLRWCPAATAGYQLFRQQSLAEGLAVRSEFGLVVSSLAYDERNSGLVRSLGRTGIADVRKGWAPLFPGKAKFEVFTHQAWVQFVRSAANRPAWCDGAEGWLRYVSDRYGL